MSMRLVLAILLAGHLTLVLAPATPAGAVLSTPAERDDCCDPQPSGEDDCCPSGCQHCSLPCCGGGLAVAAGATFGPDWPLEEQALAPVACVPARGVDPRRIYHPPRA
jgi:hypothetical protein